MKRYFFTILLMVAAVLTAGATDLTGKRIYVNPGHGSWGPNDRPMATIPYPALPTTGMPDTLGFYESNTNLWKTAELARKLRAAGAYVMESRTQNGPWPYTMVDGDYPDYTYAEYKELPNYEQYNRALSEICEEVEANGFDMFISIHSNANVDGTTTNFPIILYSGKDDGTYMRPGTRAMGENAWPYIVKRMQAGLDPASAWMSGSNVRGDVDFMGSGSWSTRSNGNQYYGYYGVLKHGVPGFLCEGYFHTYQPARHRALNPDYDKDEGIMHYRAVLNYYNADPETTGYILGTVKDKHNRISHSLFKYTPKTNDQWMPCNGAVVTLKQNGAVVATYTVDNKYNGVFYFPDLQPGMYTLEATCEGYFPLDAEQQAMQIEVKANETTYPMIYLVDENWTPEEVVYYNYEHPEQSALAGLADAYTFGAGTSTTVNEVLAGKVVRNEIVYRPDTMFVLAVDTTLHTSHLYMVNPTTGVVVDTMSTEGTQGEIYPLYSIAMTADHVLVGCNYTQNQFSDDYIYPEEEISTGVRGTWRTYYWNMADLTAAPAPWFTSQYSSNWYSAFIGNSMAVSGTLNSCVVATGTPSIWYSRTFRMACFEIDNGNVVSQYRNDAPARLTELEQTGTDWTLKVSPRADDQWIMDGSLTNQFEYAMTSDGGSFLSKGTMSAHYQHADYFLYAGRQVMVAPQVENDTLTGVVLYDITDGLDNSKAIRTNIVVDSIPAAYATAKAFVNGLDITVFVVADSVVMRYTTTGVEQPVVAHVMPYDLRQSVEGNTLTLSFASNAAAEAEVILYSEGEEVASYPMSAVKGTNTLELNMDDLPGDTLTWAVELTGDRVANWGIVKRIPAAQIGGGVGRTMNAVNVYPETDYFGYIYLMDRHGEKNAANGMYVVAPDYTIQNTTPINGGQAYHSPYRMGLSSDGFVWACDWGQPHSGVYMVDPANPTVHTPFFQGTADGPGVWRTPGGVEMGSSTPGVNIYGTGADTKLIMYNEDPGNTLPTNGITIYNVGQADGTIAHTWAQAPSAQFSLVAQGNTNGNVWGCSHGIWVAQHRSAGNNNSGAASLLFYTWDGECTFKSYQAPVDKDDQLIIDGSLGAAYAITPDESTLILNGTESNFMLFDILWEDNTPTLTYRGSYKHNLGQVDYEILQMNWDYAGNLVATGTSGMTVFAVPSEENVTLVQAPASQVITKGGEVVPQYYLAGSMNDWAPDGTAFAEDGTLELPLEAGNYEFKVTKGNWDWALDATAVDTECSSANVRNAGGNGHNIHLTLAEAETIHIAVLGDTALCITGNFAEKDLVNEYTLVGDKDLVGADWDLNAAANTMTLTGEILTLTKEEVALEAKSYKWKVVGDHSWSVQYPASGDFVLAIEEAGSYKVEFSLDLTTGEGVAVASKLQTALDGVTVVDKPVKVIENAQVIIIRDGKRYLMTGAAMK